jgi:hypothetical protein
MPIIVRRHDEAANHNSAVPWNRAIAALDKLYRWAVEEGLVGQSPFTYRDVWRRLPSGQGRTITGLAPAASTSRRRSVARRSCCGATRGVSFAERWR